MPDNQFVSLLRSKFNKDYPSEFWQWLLRQEVSRPWWTYVGDDTTLKNYVNQLYTSYSQPTTPTSTTTEAIPATGSTPWEVQGFPTEAEWANAMPAEYQNYQNTVLAGQMGIPLADLLRQQWGFPTQAQGLTPWQQEQTRQFDVQAQLQREQAQKVDLSAEWENMRQQIIGQLSGDSRNWIQKYRAENIPNPYTPPDTGDAGYQMVTERAGRAKEAWTTAKAIASEAARDPNRSLSPEEKQMVDKARDDWAAASANLLQVQHARNTGINQAEAGQPLSFQGTNPEDREWVKSAYMATPNPATMTVGGQGAIQKYETPEIPSWLQEVSGLKGRVPTKKTAISRPSAQMWGTLTPTQQQQYAGLVDYAGTTPYLDTLAQMQKELPQQPILGKRWQPARQRV